MNLRKISPLLFIVVAISSCAKTIERDYQVTPDLIYKFEIGELDYRSNINSVFLKFSLEIDNQSGEDLYFDPGKLQANVNGESNKSIYYDSIASVLLREEKLETGKKAFKLYFTFSERLRDSEIETFEITNFGLRKNQ